MDASQRLLALALVFSTLAHGGLLAVKFADPDNFRWRSRDSDLDVILVNAKHFSKPVKADALAQANLDGGGDAAKGRAQSFLTDTHRVQDGDQLQEASQRIQEIEAEQRKLLSTLKGESKIAAAEVRPQAKPDPALPTPRLTGASDVNSRILAREEAALAKRIADENARPKRAHISPLTTESVQAAYLVAWTNRIERFGNSHYPDPARGGTFRLIMTVSLFPDGQGGK